MKTHVLVFIFLLSITSSIAQKWQQTFGNPGTDEDVMDVIESYDNGYLIDGDYELNNGNWLIKTDINGNLLWDKFFTWDEGWLYWGRVDQDNEGNMVVTCQVSKPGLGTWPLVVKLNACGEKLWCRVFADYDFMFGTPRDILFLDNGDVIVLTHFESQEQIDQIFLYYINSEGNFQWKKSYASTNTHPLIGPKGGLRIFPFDDFFLIAGYCYWPYPTNPNFKKLRPLFIKINDQFEEEWIIPFGVSDSIVGEAYSLIQLNDSIFMGVGKRRFSEGGENLNNSLLMFFNSIGEELGYNQIRNDSIGPNINQNLIYDIERINDTLFITSSGFGEAYEGNPFGEFVIDTSGNVFNYQSRPNTAGVSELIKTFDNKYVIITNLQEGKAISDILLYKINEELEQDTIYPGSYTYDSLCPYPIQSGIIDVTNCAIITDVGDLPSAKEYFAGQSLISVVAYPNPAFEGSITFEFKNTKHHSDMELRCMNVFGEEIYREKVFQHQGESKVNVQNWHAGIYLALVYSNGRVVGKTKFIIK